ncbi:MAG: hypothetical protein IIW86_05955 [Clostridia bacterium]|nr:hypothetical protein [Clostridia bacterium]
MLNLNYEGTATWALSLEYKPQTVFEFRIINQQSGKATVAFVTSRESEYRTQNIEVAHATDRIIRRWSEQDQSVIKNLGFINKNGKLWLYLPPARYIYKIADETGFITIFDNSNSKTYDNSQTTNKVYEG